MKPIDPPARVHADPLEETLHRYLMTGDEEAMEQVVAATRPRLLAAARRIGSPSDAEDAVQGAYLSLVRKKGGPLEAPVLPWLLTATVRIAYRRKALSRRQREIAERLARPREGPSPVDDAVTEEIRERMWREVARLPEKYRDPVVLHHLQGVPTPEVALLLDLPEATVRTRLHRGRALLKWNVAPSLALGLLCIPWFLRDAVLGGGEPLPVAAAAGTVAVASLAGLALGTALAPPPAAAPVAPTALPREMEPEEARAEYAAMLETVTGLRERLAAARARETAATERRETAEARADAAARTAAAAAAPPVPFRSALADGPDEPDMEDIPFGRLGINLREMVVLRARVSLAMVRDEIPAPFLLGRIQELNGPLVTMALRQVEKDPAETVNTVFTHPSLAARMAEATLAEAGLPLDAAQAAGLERLAREYARREADRVRDTARDALMLERIRAAADLRQEFFEALDDLLSPAQVEVLHPASIRGRVGPDLFSAGLVWMEVLRPARVPDDAELVRRMVSELGEEFPASREPLLLLHVRQFVEGMPAAWRTPREDPMDRHGEVTVKEASELAERTVRLLENLSFALSDGKGRNEVLRRLVRIPLPLYGGERE